jgi:tRNA A37 N6-isopentenylltransferase MiaA
MTHWDYSIFNEKLGNKINYGIVIGNTCSGKTTIANYVAMKYKYKLIDMKQV